MHNLRLIGVAGTAGAGKDTVAAVISTMFGLQNLSTSDALRAITRYLYNIDPVHNPVRDQLYRVGTFIRTEVDSAMLVKLCILQAEVLQLPGGVITGLRSVGEAEAVRAAGGVVIGVDAEAHVRYNRMFSRARDADAQKTLEEFLQQDRLENRGVSDSGPGRGIQAIIDSADAVIRNDGTLEELQLEVKNKVGPLI